jgi:hypothetical protein
MTSVDLAFLDDSEPVAVTAGLVANVQIGREPWWDDHLTHLVKAVRRERRRLAELRATARAREQRSDVSATVHAKHEWNVNRHTDALRIASHELAEAKRTRQALYEQNEELIMQSRLQDFAVAASTE